jgi:hypothetical protein
MVFGVAEALENELAAIKRERETLEGKVASIRAALGLANAKNQGAQFCSLGPENIRSALINRGRDPDADRHTFEQMRNAAGMLRAGTCWNDVNHVGYTYTDANRNALAAVEDALTPRAGEYRPLTRFQRFRVRVYLPLFRLARRRGVIHS